MLIERTIFVLGIEINQEYIEKFEKKMEKLLVNEQIKQLMIDYYCEELDKTERPKKPWYRKERW